MEKKSVSMKFYEEYAVKSKKTQLEILALTNTDKGNRRYGNLFLFSGILSSALLYMYACILYIYMYDIDKYMCMCVIYDLPGKRIA